MSVRPRIVLFAAEAKVRRPLRILFQAHAYRVHEVATVDDALRDVALSAPELVVVALRADAPADVIPRLRGATSAVLIVLAPAPTDAIASALEAGADDAIPPPHARGEVLARVALALRRSRPAAARRLLRAGELTLDAESREVRVADHRVVLTRLEYRLLEALVLAQGRALSHDDLLAQVWGPAHRGRLHYLRVYIARLRRKIERDAAQPILVSVAGVGYRVAVGCDTKP